MAEKDDFEGLDAPKGSQGEGDDEAKAMAAIDALENAGEGEQSLTTTTSEGEKDDIPAGAPSGAKEEPGVTVEPSGVLAADGKHVLPYDVLKNTREAKAASDEARAQAEEAARAATEQLEATRTELEALKAGKGDPKDEEAAGDGIADLKAQAEAIRGELPAMAGMLDGMIAQLEATREESRTLRKTIETRDAEATKQREQAEQSVQAKVAQTVRGAIDSNPTLALWEASKDPKGVTAYNRACDEDEMLRKDALWAEKPMADRFAEAVRRTQLVIPDAPKLAKTLSAAEIAARAKKAVDDAGEFNPESLTDLPAGAPPGADPLESLANVDTVALGNRVAQMTDAQLEAMLARVG